MGMRPIKNPGISGAGGLEVLTLLSFVVLWFVVCEDGLNGEALW